MHRRKIQISNQTITIESTSPLFQDKKGWLISAAGTESLEHTMLQPRLISTVPGAIRGNHYHEKEGEIMILLNGIWQIKISSLDQSESEELKLECNALPVKIVMPPNIGHAFKNISKNINYLFHYSDVPYTINRSQKMHLL